MKIAVTMPGKIGDLLYSLPTVRYVSKILGDKVDFWTQKECLPVKRLLENQSYINKVYINESYVKQHDQCGVQPWFLEPEGKYDRIYHMGLRDYPKGRLVDYYPQIHGFTMCDTTISYDFDKKEIDKGICVSPGRNPALKSLFAHIMLHYSKVGPVYQIGPANELVNIPVPNIINVTGDMYDCLPYIDASHLFFGTLSANLVLANGFSCKKVVVCEKERRFAPHDIKDNHIYLDFPTTLEEVLSGEAV